MAGPEEEETDLFTPPIHRFKHITRYFRETGDWLWRSHYVKCVIVVLCDVIAVRTSCIQYICTFACALGGVPCVNVDCLLCFRPDGRIDLPVVVPKEPMSWLIGAFAMSIDHGLGVIVQPARHQSSRPFYIQVRAAVLVKQNVIMSCDKS